MTGLPIYNRQILLNLSAMYLGYEVILISNKNQSMVYIHPGAALLSDRLSDSVTFLHTNSLSLLSRSIAQVYCAPTRPLG